MKNLIKEIKNNRSVEAHVIRDLLKSTKIHKKFSIHDDYGYDFYYENENSIIHDESIMRYKHASRELVIMQAYEDLLVEKYNITNNEFLKIIKNSLEISEIVGEIDILI